MSSGEVVGKVLQPFEETTVEWKIANFIPMMSEDPGTSYSSPPFAFSDVICCLKIYPNGRDKSEAAVGCILYLDETHDYEIVCKISLKTRPGILEHTNEYAFRHKYSPGLYCWVGLCSVSELKIRKSLLLPGGSLTVHCNLRRSEPRLVAIPRLQRSKKVCRDSKKLLTANKSTDLVFKFGEREVRAHKLILENRSEYFQKMFSHDMVESRTGTITIDDCEPEVFQQVLSYIYSGEMDALCVGNMLQLYVAADRYQLDDLKQICAAFMEENISADLFCDVLVVADAHNDTILMQIAKDFVIQNSNIILETEQWKRFRKEHSNIAFELLQTILMENAEKLRVSEWGSY